MARRNIIAEFLNPPLTPSGEKAFAVEGENSPEGAAIPILADFSQYKRKELSEMRPYIKGEDLTGVSVSAPDTPETDMGMIARNPTNHADRWYVARKYFEDNLEPVGATVVEILDTRLEAAANLLLSQFTPAVSTFCQEVADVVLKIPRWQLVCGSLLAQFEGGSLPAPSIDPAWIHESTATGTRVCEYCEKDFVPFKAFQRYCTNGCGTKAALAKRQEALGGMAVGAS